MSNLQQYLTMFDNGQLSALEAVGLMVHILNNRMVDLETRYTTAIYEMRRAGALRYDERARCWIADAALVQSITAAPKKKKGGRPRKQRELVPISVYLDPAVAEALDRVVGYTTFSRSAYINFIIKKHLQDRKEV